MAPKHGQECDASPGLRDLSKPAPRGRMFHPSRVCKVQSTPATKKNKNKNKNKNKQNKQNKQRDQQTKPQKWELLEAVAMSLAGNPGRRSSAPSWPPCATATYHRARQPADHVLVGHRYCCGRQHPVAAGWLWLAGCGLQRLSSCCKTSTTVCGHGTHIRIFLCVSVCVVSLLSDLPRRRVHAVHAFSDWTPCQSNELCVHHFCGGSHNTRMHSIHDWSLCSRLPA